MTVGDEVVFRVTSTGSGFKVTRYDGTGLRDGLCGKKNLRYFYGDDAEEDATAHATRKATMWRELNGDDTRVVPAGERI